MVDTLDLGSDVERRAVSSTVTGTNISLSLCHWKINPQRRGKKNEKTRIFRHAKRHQKELEGFSIAYAFNDEQLEEALRKLEANSKEECVTIFGQRDI